MTPSEAPALYDPAPKPPVLAMRYHGPDGPAVPGVDGHRPNVDAVQAFARENGALVEPTGYWGDWEAAIAERGPRGHRYDLLLRPWPSSDRGPQDGMTVKPGSWLLVHDPLPASHPARLDHRTREGRVVVLSDDQFRSRYRPQQ